MKSAKLASISAPEHFEILLRVTFNDENWCLISRQKTAVEIEMEKLEKVDSLSSGSVLSWFREPEVLDWKDTIDNNNSTSTFSINENDFPTLPSTLQEQMTESFAAEKAGEDNVLNYIYLISNLSLLIKAYWKLLLI